MPVVVMGRLPELFSNPEQFFPERWDRDNKENMHSFASLPFGTGPRMCVGKETYSLVCRYYSSSFIIALIGRRLAELELNIALSQIMKAYRVEFTEKEPMGYIIKFLLVPERQMNLAFRDLQ